RRRRSPNRAPPERCRHSGRESTACRFRSSSRDIAHAGCHITERDWHRLPANKGQRLPSRGQESCLFRLSAKLSWRPGPVTLSTFPPPITMSNDRVAQSGEERLIARYFAPLAKHPGAFGLADDAAALAPPAGCGPVVKARWRVCVGD